MNWRQLSFQTSASLGEDAIEQLEAAGALSVTLTAAENEEIYEPALNTSPLWRQTLVTSLFDEALDLQPLITQLQQNFSFANYTLELIPEEDWQQNYRKSVQPICIANTLWICPSWHDLPEPNKPHIILDPGLAFGTGTHPTTALCLQWLVENINPGDTVIDYGCGSGILAIAALKLGAKEAWAIDHDPQALEATAENARRNQCSSHLHPALPTEMPPLRADVLVANILSNPLIEMAERFSQLLRPRGRIALSGILSHQAIEVMAAYQTWLQFNPSVIQEEWVRLDGDKTS